MLKQNGGRRVCSTIHCEIVCRVVLHEENKQTSFVLDNAKLPADLLIG